MHKHIPAARWPLPLALILLCVLLPACRPAMTGVSGMSLARSNYPAVQVTVLDETLPLAGYGRRYPSLKSDIMTISPTGVADLAIYGDAADGPVTRHAHIIIVRPNNENLWRFTSDGWKGPRDILVSASPLGELNAVDRIFLVESQGDWFSEFWRINGREVPERWLARRWSASPTDDIRVVAEYREPWPASLDPDELAGAGLLLTGSRLLHEFRGRSAGVFTASREALDHYEDPARTSLPLPSGSPNMTRLAGEVEERDRGFRRPR